ncbi:hypothetical protein SULI_12660 [Saccharolobus solfataricus]|uniref:Uncharacterized protein n=1 Tax=Saccharolobus solfataricus TaxID=2287 RepID=A0A0E3K6M2_SACSO|nr:hypothetical protein SULG_12660 [Saccharolobus solfataricus]AZF71714.1 hypothetical protein SULH_12660 [Saccharolobus solfataricus]AZF74334.1 hypothetical protein SULI_12660 [Saccharolobus solfataricus]AZF76957.1 hypothetical protein SULM_12650 [Saccharolobus solfataricus]AZF82168.1 hypothetical protein SULO_12660 [Saccharolobus solfataricus]
MVDTLCKNGLLFVLFMLVFPRKGLCPLQNAESLALLRYSQNRIIKNNCFLFITNDHELYDYFI